ncbi:LVIVD repeat-containing protein [Micromonospora sp. GCM10011542]|uniref:LVIVD repeat-containing protein n=1 Tax=Micromonospora sp. GCM10011542 TaxID=3317337 RepID=UPI00360C7C38
MLRRTPQESRRLAIGLAATGALLLTAVVAAAPASGATDSSGSTGICESFEAAGDNFAEYCIAEEAANDVAAANTTPGVDEIASTTNIRQIANIPKFGGFASEGAYNSDLAFQGNYVFAGNYEGFNVFDVSNPSSPQVVSQVVCSGSQGDPSVMGNLLFLAVDAPRSNDSCNSTSGSSTQQSSWEGVRIFDISDKANPRYVKSVRTDCGSHTQTLVPSKDGKSVYVYVQSYGPSSGAFYCKPPHDKISIIKVPVDNPADASVVATPVLFPGTSGAGSTSGCHDITAYPELDLAAGACMGDGVLFDISDRENPVVISQVRDTNFAFWHSATFNNAGTKVVFTDELGGGSSAICTSTYRANQGADAIYDIVGSGADRELVFKSYFKIPRLNTTLENCVAHNGSLIPAMGRDVMVQAWYQGGISVIDFTDSANPVEIAYWERGPLSDTRRILGGAWSTYYHNGYIYSNDIQKGLDVLKLDDPRTNNARAVSFAELNVQTQPSYPACTTVMRERQNGDLTVTSGITCLDGATVNGKTKVAPGAGLIAFNSTLNGSVTATDASVVSIVESRVNGSVHALGGTVRDSKVNGSVTTS